jgi:hypothetical protein
MKMLLCSVGSKRRMTTLRFGAAVAKALSADVALLGVVSDKQQVEDLQGIVDQVAQEMAQAGLRVQVRVE